MDLGRWLTERSISQAPVHIDVREGGMAIENAAGIAGCNSGGATGSALCRIVSISRLNMILECTIEEYLAELERQSTQAQALTDGLDEAALNWQPDGGKAWSVAQCIEHLSATNAFYLAAIRGAVERNEDQIPRGPGIYRPAGWPSRKFIQSMEPESKRKFRTFRKIAPATSQYRRDQVLSQFVTKQKDLAEFVSKSSEMDLGSLRFHNPFLKGVHLTVSSGLLLIGAHNRRHLRQAENVKKDAEFPRAS